MRHATKRAGLLPALLFLGACATAPSIDPLVHARHTLEGFHDASPWVAEALEGAAAWAVFSGVVDGEHDCGHDGVLFLADGASRPARLVCSDRPLAPAGIAYHQLVILRDPRDVAQLQQGPLDLTEAVEHSTADLAGDPEAPRLIVTTSRTTILFEHRELRQVLELLRAPLVP